MKLKLIKPKALPPGSRVGIVACSSPMSQASNEIIDLAFARIRSIGWEPIEATNLRKKVGHTAGSLSERVRALHGFFRDPKIDGILSFWGGLQSHQLLEELDYALIRKNPKVLLGYSDTTALQVGIYSKTGLVTFSGPAGITFGKPEIPEFTLEHLFKTVMEPEVPLRLKESEKISQNLWFKHPKGEMVFETNPGMRTFRKGRAEGRLIGGNVGTMLLLAGTPYWPNLKGAILFIEEDESEKPGTVDRMLTQLRQMGVFKEISGLVVGRFSPEVGWSQDDSFDAVLENALRGYRFPVITGADFGHTDPLVTLPIGVRCAIDASKKKIELLESGVRE